MYRPLQSVHAECIAPGGLWPMKGICKSSLDQRHVHICQPVGGGRGTPLENSCFICQIGFSLKLSPSILLSSVYLLWENDGQINNLANAHAVKDDCAHNQSDSSFILNATQFNFRVLAKWNCAWRVVRERVGSSTVRSNPCAISCYDFRYDSRRSEQISPAFQGPQPTVVKHSKQESK